MPACLLQHLLVLLQLVAQRALALLPTKPADDGDEEQVEKRDRLEAGYSNVFEATMTPEQLNEYSTNHKLSREEHNQGFRVRDDGETLYKVRDK